MSSDSDSSLNPRRRSSRTAQFRDTPKPKPPEPDLGAEQTRIGRGIEGEKVRSAATGETTGEAPAQGDNQLRTLPWQLGTFRAERLLGKGGMGEVYMGFDENLQRPVAIKVLSERLSKDATHVTRFLGEGRAVARINHQNVVQVYFAGSVDDTHFIALEFVDGYSLDDEVKKRGYIEPVQAIGFAMDCVLGLKLSLIHI